MSTNVDAIIAANAINTITNIDLVLSNNEAYKQEKLCYCDKLCKQKEKKNYQKIII